MLLNCGAVVGVLLGRFLLEVLYSCRSFHRLGDGSGSSHTTARTSHTLQQITLAFSGLGNHQHFFAVAQALCPVHLNLDIRIQRVHLLF